MKGSIGANTSTILYVPNWAKKRESKKMKEAKKRLEKQIKIRKRALG